MITIMMKKTKLLALILFGQDLLLTVHWQVSKMQLQKLFLNWSEGQAAKVIMIIGMTNIILHLTNHLILLHHQQVMQFLE